MANLKVLTRNLKLFAIKIIVQIVKKDTTVNKNCNVKRLPKAWIALIPIFVEGTTRKIASIVVPIIDQRVNIRKVKFDFFITFLVLVAIICCIVLIYNVLVLVGLCIILL